MNDLAAMARNIAERARKKRKVGRRRRAKKRFRNRDRSVEGERNRPRRTGSAVAPKAIDREKPLILPTRKKDDQFGKSGVQQDHDGVSATNFLNIISNPNIAYILMILGFYGLYFELSNPGSDLPRRSRRHLPYPGFLCAPYASDQLCRPDAHHSRASPCSLPKPLSRVTACSASGGHRDGYRLGHADRSPRPASHLLGGHHPCCRAFGAAVHHYGRLR